GSGTVLVSLFSVRIGNGTAPVGPAGRDDDQSPLRRMLEASARAHGAAGRWSVETSSTVLTAVEPPAGLLSRGIGPWSTALDKTHMAALTARKLFHQYERSVRLDFTFSYFHAVPAQN